MIPESSSQSKVDLYKCVEFPYKWEFVTTLVAGKSLADATIIRRDGLWWMFAAHAYPGTSNYDELHIYWSNELVGPWFPHALNPVKIDAGSARPAGSLFLDGDRLIRPAQDCRAKYGNWVVFNEITRLDKVGFHERILDRLLVGDIPASVGSHTFNRLKDVIAIDSSDLVSRIG